LTTFSITLLADAVARRIVLVSGACACLGGVAAIVAMPLDVVGKWLGVIAWLLVGGNELRLTVSRYRDCRRLRIEPGGSIEVGGRDGSWRAATLCPGSLVLRRWAWLRFDAGEGRRHQELFRRRAAKTEDWRRLQVIWRHLGAAL